MGKEKWERPGADGHLSASVEGRVSPSSGADGDYCCRGTMQIQLAGKDKPQPRANSMPANVHHAPAVALYISIRKHTTPYPAPPSSNPSLASACPPLWPQTPQTPRHPTPTRTDSHHLPSLAGKACTAPVVASSPPSRARKCMRTSGKRRHGLCHTTRARFSCKQTGRRLCFSSYADSTSYLER